MNDNEENHFSKELEGTPETESAEPSVSGQNDTGEPIILPETITPPQETEEAALTEEKPAEQPEVQQPEVQQPEVQQPEVRQPEVRQPEVQQPETQQPEVQQAETQQLVTPQNPYQAYGQYGQSNTYGQNQNPYQPSGQYGQQNTYGQNQSPYQAYGQYGQRNPYGQYQNPNQIYGQYGQQNPYGQNHNQNPNQPYGQYQNPNQIYGQYGQQNPYGQNQNPNQPYGGQYNQQNPYGQNQNPNQPYGVQYGQNQNPNQSNGQNPKPTQQDGKQNPYYPQNNNPVQPPQPPKKMSKGLKVFLWIAGIITTLCIIGFLVVGVVETIQALKDGDGWSQSEDFSSQYDDEEQYGTESQSSGMQNGQTDPNNSGIKLESRPDGDKLDPDNIYKNMVESVVGIRTIYADNQEETQGSGIVATQDGYIITNSHVVGNSKVNKVIVILHDDEKEYSAAVVGYDSTTDLAILKIGKPGLHPAVFGNSDQLQVGDRVIAIGNPGGVNFSSTLTVGYVSALNRKLQTRNSNEMTFIQTDAAINPGNSGGPLVNMYGQVVGINSNKIMATGYEGMGFSIPTIRAKTVLDQLITRGYVAGRARLGITVKDMTEEEAQKSRLPQGVVVLNISSGSDFQNKGVVSGDIITKMDGKRITSKSELFDLLSKHKPGDVVKVTIYSASSRGASKDVSITLIEGKE